MCYLCNRFLTKLVTKGPTTYLHVAKENCAPLQEGPQALGPVAESLKSDIIQGGKDFVRVLHVSIVDVCKLACRIRYIYLLQKNLLFLV
jgi:hypothetical protein